jgi:RNA polymerase sigma factor (sigma-70 family)
MHTDPDHDIIERAVGGDHAAFRTIVEAYQHKALSLAQRIVKDRSVAEDAVQDAFIRMYRSIASFRGDSQFSTWVYRIVYTTCLNILRAQRRAPILDPLDEEAPPSWVEPEIFDQLDRSMIEEVLQDELQKMSPTYAAVMDLFYVKECSYEEIVRVTGMPLGTVKTRLNRGRAILRDALFVRLPELRP